MSTVELNGVTVYVSAIESVEDGVSREYDSAWDRYRGDAMLAAHARLSIRDLRDCREEIERPVPPKREDYPAVIVKLTSGREFRIVGKTRAEVENDILWAKRRGDDG